MRQIIGEQQKSEQINSPQFCTGVFFPLKDFLCSTQVTEQYCPMLPNTNCALPSLFMALIFLTILFTSFQQFIIQLFPSPPVPLSSSAEKPRRKPWSGRLITAELAALPLIATESKPGGSTPERIYWLYFHAPDYSLFIRFHRGSETNIIYRQGNYGSLHFPGSLRAMLNTFLPSTSLLCNPGLLFVPL